MTTAERKTKTRLAPFQILSIKLAEFLTTHPPPCHPQILLDTLPKRWSIYPPLLLLPPTTFTSPDWKTYLASLPPLLRTDFYEIFTSTFRGTTHVAVNAPIVSDTLRSPSITPLHGDFRAL